MLPGFQRLVSQVHATTHDDVMEPHSYETNLGITLFCCLGADLWLSYQLRALPNVA
jgi:hypothetical protein